MQPEDVLVITLDNQVHQVDVREAITIGVQTGAIVPMQIADPANPEVLTVVEMREPGPIAELPGTRFTGRCGMSFDALNADVGTGDRWEQGVAVSCAECMA